MSHCLDLKFLEALFFCHNLWSCSSIAMLTEAFVAGTLAPAKTSNTTLTGIHVHDLQPIPALKSTFKRSSCKANCLAVSRTHIFAAQSDKAVVHVFSRERNNQEATVPFPERVTSIALAGHRDAAGVLAVGTESGRIVLWEVSGCHNTLTPFATIILTIPSS